MYIRKVQKKNRSSPKIYEYLHLIENVRTENGPRQRLILNLGNIDIPEDKYKELATHFASYAALLSSDANPQGNSRTKAHGIPKVMGIIKFTLRIVLTISLGEHLNLIEQSLVA